VHAKRSPSHGINREARVSKIHHYSTFIKQLGKGLRMPPPRATSSFVSQGGPNSPLHPKDAHTHIVCSQRSDSDFVLAAELGTPRLVLRAQKGWVGLCWTPGWMVALTRSVRSFIRCVICCSEEERTASSSRRSASWRAMIWPKSRRILS